MTRRTLPLMLGAILLLPTLAPPAQAGPRGRRAAVRGHRSGGNGWTHGGRASAGPGRGHRGNRRGFGNGYGRGYSRGYGHGYGYGHHSRWNDAARAAVGFWAVTGLGRALNPPRYVARPQVVYPASQACYPSGGISYQGYAPGGYVEEVVYVTHPYYGY